MKQNSKLKIVIIVISVFLLAAGAGFGALYLNGLSGVPTATEPQPGQIKVACVGDSVTYGHGITGWPAGSYPAQLAGLLGEGYHVNSYGSSGRAVQNDSDQPYTALPLYQQSLDYDADIVVFMMGSNDSKPENWHGAEEFRAALTSLLDSYGDAEILLCTPPTAFFTGGQTEGLASFDIQPLVVDEIAQVVRSVAAERDLTLIDIHALTAGHPEWFVSDAVHPNNEGAAAIAQEVYESLIEKQ